MGVGVASASRYLELEPARPTTRGQHRARRVTAGQSCVARRRNHSSGSPSPSPSAMTSPIAIVWSPPAISSRSSHAAQASAPSMIGMPCLDPVLDALELLGLGQLRGEHAARGAPGRRCRMLTREAPASRTIGSVRAWFSKHTSASSGSSDSEQIAFAVMPPAPLGPALVITATPVAKRPNTSRNSSWIGRAPSPGWLYRLSAPRATTCPGADLLVAAVEGRSRVG